MTFRFLSASHLLVTEAPPLHTNDIALGNFMQIFHCPDDLFLLMYVVFQVSQDDLPLNFQDEACVLDYYYRQILFLRVCF